MAELDKIFAKAAEIAQKLPDNLQEAAFNRALDELLGESQSGRRAAKARSASKGKKSANEKGPAADELGDIIGLIDRTKYPDIGDTGRTADRALKVLQLANDDLGIDGLSASQIAEILTKKFRLPVKSNAVQMALQRESQTVDVGAGPGGKNLFHIMAPGDEYLANLRAGDVTPTTRKAKKAAKKKTKKKTSVRKKISGKKKSSKKSAKRKSSSLGPKAAIGKLIEAGYFGQARQISEIQEELKHTRGHTFSVQELSPALIRCVRDESLSRVRNESGHYEYAKA